MATEVEPLRISNVDYHENGHFPQSQSTASQERGESELKHTNWESIWLDTWIFEWIMLFFSASCFIATCVILKVYDGKVRPEMAYGVTLNAIISALATGCKSSLILVIGEALCQLKWQWFQNPKRRELSDMQTFDAASRGPLGSILLVISHHGYSLASLGATVIVLLLVFEPFMQQIIDYHLQPVAHAKDGAKAAAPQVDRFHFAPLNVSEQENEIFTTMIEGVAGKVDISQVSPNCPSGTCTWDPFPSLGICTRCVDMTAAATLNCAVPDGNEISNLTCHLNLPDRMNDEKMDPNWPGAGLSSFQVIHNETSDELDMPQHIIWCSQMLQYWAATFAPDVFWGNSTVASNPLPLVSGIDHPMVAYAHAELGLYDRHGSINGSFANRIFVKNVTECILQVCLKDYHVSVKNGHVFMETSNPDFGIINGTLRSLATNTDICWQPSRPAISSGPPTANFHFCDNGYMNMLQNIMIDYRLFIRKGLWSNIASGQKQHQTWLLDGQSDYFLEFLFQNGFGRVMQGLGDALTKRGLANTNLSVPGTAYTDTVFVKVYWPWLILPGVLVFAGIIFMALTNFIGTGSHVPLWKSSAIASFYHGLDSLENHHKVPANTSSMEKKSKKTRVQLQYSEKHGHLMLRE